jgi:medium-chain acyl-[acyl-carrier-protein] hydrolase
MHRPAAGCRLLCLPYAGGTASVYRSWPPLLGDEIEVLAVELPGHGTRRNETPISSAAELVEHISHGVQGEVGGRWAVFGHSMGGLLGILLAQALVEKRVGIPVCVIVSAAAPSAALARFGGADRPLSDGDVVARLRTIGGIPGSPRTTEALSPQELQVFRADLRVADACRPTAVTKLPCPIHVLGGRLDPAVAPHRLHGWQDYTNVPIKVKLFDGAHFYHLQHPRLVLAHIRHAVLRSLA